MADALALALSCASCGGNVEVQTTDWHPDDPQIDQTYACPYCGKTNDAGMAGRVLWAVKGHYGQTLAAQ